jgi:recombination protein RecR
MNDEPLDQLIRTFSRLPGLGPRSARRIALFLLTNKDDAMTPLVSALEKTAATINVCNQCGNLDTINPCRICSDNKRNDKVLCVVRNVADLWAIERTGTHKGLYHVLGGLLSALDGIGPEDLKIKELLKRIEILEPEEIIMALSATVDGQSTAHYLGDKILDQTDIKITRLAHGVPVGGELDYLDDGTITTALKSRSGV